MVYEYTTNGTCSRKIYIDVEDGKVMDVQYMGGCPGNVQGIARLVSGMPIDEVIERLEGIRCGSKPTSCPDQLATALKRIKNNEVKEK